MASKALYIDQPGNPREIPTAVFLEDPATYIGLHYTATVEGAETVLRQLHELYGKYKFIESRIVQQKRSLLSKLPEIESALKSLNYLEKAEGKEIDTHFELSDAVYCKATIEKNDKVFLWLGANVMVEYTYEDAKSLLEQNRDGALKTLSTLNSDLEYLKDQITVSEVNISRTHNYQVKLREKAGLIQRPQGSK